MRSDGKRGAKFRWERYAGCLRGLNKKDTCVPGEGEPTRERGGRAKRFFKIAGLGERALILKEQEYRQRAASLRAGMTTRGGAA